jgi:sarcosine oxidase
MQTHYDYIVLGCGGIGSAALYWLSRRAGQNVLGIEQYPLFHHNGGSQDYSRIIRLAYHEEKYARLTPHAYRAWETVSEESAVQVVTETGGIQIGYADSPYAQDIENYAHAMDRANIPYDRFGADELRQRFPQFTPGDEVIVLYQQKTGIADPSRGNAAHITLAEGYGATVLAGNPVLGITPNDDDSVTIQTEQGTFTCRRLVITAGAWTKPLVEKLGIPLPITVTKEQVTYYRTPHLKDFAIGRFPVFQWKDDFSHYGFPVYGEVATKAAIDASGDETTAATRNFEPNHAREDKLTRFLQARIPKFVGPRLYTKTCLYAMPPDRDFLLDSLPGHPQIIACVGAGHAYKFASVLGQILSELAIDSQTDHDISAFSGLRPALTDTAFVPNIRI